MSSERKYQYNHLFGKSDGKYEKTQIDVIWNQLFDKQGQLGAFTQLLKMQKNRMSTSKKKLLTLNSLCALIPFVRHPKEMIISRIVKNSAKYRIDDKMLLGKNFTKFCVCQDFMAYDTKDGVSIMSLISGKNLCDLHLWNNDCKIIQLQMKYHPFMQSIYKAKFKRKDEVFVYSLYVLYAKDNLLHLKKILVCDSLCGNLEYLDDNFQFLSRYSALNLELCSFSVCDWDCCNFDAVILNDPEKHRVCLCLDDGTVYELSCHGNEKASNRVHVKFQYWDSSCVINSSSIVNVTKPFLKYGLTLLDVEKYSDFIVLEVKVCYDMDVPEYLQSLAKHLEDKSISWETIYITIAKKKVKDTSQYSFMWKSAQHQYQAPEINYSIDFKNPFTKRQTFTELVNRTYFIDQGRILKNHVSFYEFDRDDIYDLFPVKFITNYDSWKLNEFPYPKNFEESLLRREIEQQLANGKSQNTNIIFYGNNEDGWIIARNVKQSNKIYLISLFNY